MSKQQQQPSCETCRYSKPEGEVDMAQCRRNPPLVIERVIDMFWRKEPDIDLPEAVYFATCFPRVDEFDWCGEHRPKELQP